MRLLPIHVDKKTVCDPAIDRTSLLAMVNSLWDAQPGKSELIDDQFEQLVNARQAFRAGDMFLACTLLRDVKCSEAFNLGGVVREALGDHAGARKMYQRALKVDRDCSAAEMNLRRSYELWQFGRSEIPFVL